MFFISKLIELFLIPSNLIALIGLVGLLSIHANRPRLGRISVMASVLLLVICGWTPVGPAALMVLENRFPLPIINRPVVGVIVLGGE